MVVDDEPFNIEAVKGLLRVLKFDSVKHVDYGYNGEEAVEFISRAINDGDMDRYGLIITDCSMPFLDGYEATKWIRAMLKLARGDEEESKDPEPLKIVAVTGHVEPEYISKAKQSGMDEVFGKPMTALLLAQILFKNGYIEEVPARLL